jgi:acetoin utilization protein AcuB
MQVQDLMTSSPEIVDFTETVSVALARLIELDVRHLPVVREGELIGIVSERDFRGYLLDAELGALDPQESEARMNNPVTSIMQSNPLVVDMEAPLTDAIELLLDNKVSALPVVEEGTMSLKGIISYVDILRESQRLFDQEK